MGKRPAIFLFLLLSVGCGKSAKEKLTKISDDFVFGSLAFSPSAATSAGLHEYDGKKLDDLLDDNSPQNLARQVNFYGKIRDRLAELKEDQLDAEDRADLAILKDQAALSLLDL